MSETKKGTVIILNAPSSCGKTRLSKALQNAFPEPLYYLSYDLVHNKMIPTISKHSENPEYDFLSVMYEMAKTISDTGNCVIVDNCFFDTQNVYEKALEILSDTSILLVRGKCEAEELNRRERDRGDREIGKAAWQEEHIKPKNDEDYDLVIDTSKEPTDESVNRIIKAVYKN